MLNDYGKEMFKPWCSVQNVVAALAVLFLMALGITHFSLNSSEVASWVQAIGSIAAILGAFSISNRQTKLHQENAAAEERKKKQRFKSIILLLAHQHSDYLRRLKKAVQKANYETGTVQPYLKSGYALKWPSHLEALKSIDINQLDPNHLSVVMEMQVAALFSLELCARLSAHWESFGDREAEAMERLEHFSRLAKDNIVYLEIEPWEFL